MDKQPQKPLDPYKTVCVCKHEGVEVGRIAATAANASAYIDGLTRQYGSLTVDYVEDATYAMVSSLLSGRRRSNY